MNVTIDRSLLIPSVLPLRLAPPFSPLLLLELIHLHFSLCGIIYSLLEPASRAWVFTSELAPRHPHLTILRSTNLRIVSQTSKVCESFSTADKINLMRTRRLITSMKTVSTADKIDEDGLEGCFPQSLSLILIGHGVPCHKHREDEGRDCLQRRDDKRQTTPMYSSGSRAPKKSDPANTHPSTLHTHPPCSAHTAMDGSRSGLKFCSDPNDRSTHLPGVASGAML
jgi:hypothetical protein